MRRPFPRAVFGALVLVVVVLLASCSGSVDFSFGGNTPAEAAVDLIQGDAMAQRLGLDALTDATCDDPPNRDDGTVFGCTAISGGETVEFEVTLEADDRIFAGATNVVAKALLADYESGAVRALNDENGFTLLDTAMDCGDQSVVLTPDRQMFCTITDDGTGTVFDAVMTIKDVDLGTFSVEIVDVAE